MIFIIYDILIVTPAKTVLFRTKKSSVIFHLYVSNCKVSTVFFQSSFDANAYFSYFSGIKHFKAGETVEAFQCLNMALKMDPENVEGLVARGALYANGGSLDKVT